MAKSTAHAHWTGDLLEGSGSVSTESPALKNTELTWKSRIGETAGTTPEELLASAHAGCYSMAFSGALAKEGHAPTSLDVDATYEFGQVSDGFAITNVELTVSGDVPGIDEATFTKLAEGAKVGCPVSKIMAGNVEIKLNAKLAQHA
jgi:osmotically inducible protein OsmC